MPHPRTVRILSSRADPHHSNTEGTIHRNSSSTLNNSMRNSSLTLNSSTHNSTLTPNNNNTLNSNLTRNNSSPVSGLHFAWAVQVDVLHMLLTDGQLCCVS